MSPDTNSTVGSTILQGGMTAFLLAFLNDVITIMLPFLIVAVILIIVDLRFGVPAAKKRDDRVTFSKGFRKTVNKIADYLCWVVLAATLAVALNEPKINWIVMSLVIINEILSIVENYLFVHGKKISGIHEFFLKIVGKKVGVDTTDLKIESIPEKKHSRKK